MKRRWATTSMMLTIGVLLVALAGVALAQEPPTDLSLADATVPVDGTVKVDLIADTLPTGLAGFIILSTTTEDGISVPVLIEAPPYGLVRVTQLADGSIELSVADLVRLVEPGAVDVTLGTVTFSGVSTGTTTASILVTRFDGDDGVPITTTVTPGLLTVVASRDLDGDGITEDVDGNGIFGFGDIVTLFELLAPTP